MKFRFFLFPIAFLLIQSTLIAQTAWQPKPITIKTRWTSKVNPKHVLPEYPRPQLVRCNWTNLNGLWDYAVTDSNITSVNNYDGKILVPYPIESSLSGVKKSLQPNQLLWYKRNITKPALKAGERILLHFGAVDFDATVFVNGIEVGNHKGGYQNFSYDITNVLKRGSNELLVTVWDPSDQGPNPHGKQVLDPQGIMYTPSSGIWQTVWMEVVPENYIESLNIIPDIDNKQVRIKVNALKDAPVTLTTNGKTVKGKSNTEIVFPLTTLNLWSPDNPYLYDLVVSMGADKVKSYFGMRKISITKDVNGIDRIFLNNKYTYNLGTLDQGFWPDGLYTAPTDEALQYDIKAIKAMGFNTIRKHIKVEPDRWYYYTDKLGMLVWQDMVNPGNDTEEGRRQFEMECKENIRQLYNHPSIITWVLFNEGWGAYDQERLAGWMKELDSTRLLDGHTGAVIVEGKVDDLNPIIEKSVNSDMADVHSYPPPAIPPYVNGKAMVLGEFGGITVPIEGHQWDDLQIVTGYGTFINPSQMKIKYSIMTDSLIAFEKRGLSASIYTQPFDVEGEQNGLMSYDRQIIKLPAATIRAINEKLWPATSNYAIATKGFAATAVSDKSTENYASKLKQYDNGRRDSAFLRSLGIMALGQKDSLNISRIGNEYIQIIKAPLANYNINFLIKVTNNYTDKGFQILLDALTKINNQQLHDKASRKIQRIVFNIEVKPLLTQKPNWSKVNDIIAKFKEVDGEFVIGLSVVEYLNAAIHNEPRGTTKNIVEAATIYDNRFNGGAYNTWAWILFERSKDVSELLKALEWSKKSLEREPTDANNIDTYANLLYKLGKKDEAMEWESKAIRLDPNSDRKKKTYEKMKNGTPTWPSSN